VRSLVVRDQGLEYVFYDQGLESQSQAGAHARLADCYDNALCGSKTQPQAQPGMMDNNPLGVRLERRAVKVVWCAVLTAPGAHHDKYAGARNLV